MKKNKRIIVFFLCFCLLFQFFEVPIDASVIDMPSDTYLKGLIATTLVSAGLVFTSAEALNDTVEKVKLRIIEGGLDSTIPQKPNDPKPPRTWRDFFKSLVKGYIVFDVSRQLYKNVVELGNDFFYFIKSFVDDNYDEGDNVINKEGWNVSDGNYITINNIEIGDTVKAFLVNRGYVILKRTGERGADIYLRSGGNVWELNPTAISNVYTSGFTLISENNLLRLKFGETYFGQVEIDNYIDNDEFTNGKIVGTPDIVDNPNYDWNNFQSGNKSVSLDVATGPGGLPIFTPDGLPSLNLSPDFMVDVTPGVVTDQDLSGHPYTPNAGEVPYPDIEFTPIEDVPAFQGENIGLLKSIVNWVSLIGNELLGLPVKLFSAPSDLSLDFSKLKLTDFKNKFPFSIPWDIARCITVFAKSPTAPDLNIDIDTEYLQIQHSIDVSRIDFPLRFARYAASVFFIMYLAGKTRDVIKW